MASTQAYLAKHNSIKFIKKNSVSNLKKNFQDESSVPLQPPQFGIVAMKNSHLRPASAGSNVASKQDVVNNALLKRAATEKSPRPSPKYPPRASAAFAPETKSKPFDWGGTDKLFKSKHSSSKDAAIKHKTSPKPTKAVSSMPVSVKTLQDMKGSLRVTATSETKSDVQKNNPLDTESISDFPHRQSKIKGKSSNINNGDNSSDQNSLSCKRPTFEKVNYGRQLSAFLKMKEEMQSGRGPQSLKFHPVVEREPSYSPETKSILSSNGPPAFPPNKDLPERKGIVADRKNVLHPVPAQSSQNPTSQSYDGVVILSPKDNCPIPGKPPRTFEHDMYVEDKKKSTPTTGVKLPTVSQAYEEIDDSALVNNVVPKTKFPPPPPVRTTPVLPPRTDIPPRSDDSFVRVKQRSKKLPPAAFVAKPKLDNPNYEKELNISPEAVKSSKKVSDPSSSGGSEYVYATPKELLPPLSAQDYEDDDVKYSIGYSDPLDQLIPIERRQKNISDAAEGVIFDTDGYASPVATSDGQQTPISPNTLLRRPAFKIPKSRAEEVEAFLYERQTSERKHSDGTVKSYVNLRTIRAKVRSAFHSFHEDGNNIFGNYVSDEEDSDHDRDDESDVDLDEHQKRMDYLSALQRKEYETTYRWLPNTSLHSRLFSYFAIVGLEPCGDDSDRLRPVAITSYPVKDKAELDMVALFSFPDIDRMTLNSKDTITSVYGFVITDIAGNRSYGYCIRLPLSGRSCITQNEVLCVISSVPATTFYVAFLYEMKRYHGNDNLSQIRGQMKEAYSHPLPGPGIEALITNTNVDSKPLKVMRSQSTILEKASFYRLLKQLSIHNLLNAFGAMLMESKVILVSKDICILSACSTALASLLYPYIWQHTFIPVLPAKMIEVCCAPTPYIIGILDYMVPHLKELPLEEYLLVDLDNDQLTCSELHESTILPNKVIKALTAALKLASGTGIDHANAIISDSFLRLFVETTGNYCECIEVQDDETSIFHMEMFWKTLSSKSMRMFLEWFTQTQMFNVFICDRLEGIESMDGYFEEQVNIYREEMSKVSPTFRENLKVIRKKMKKFVKVKGVKLKKKMRGSANEFV